MNLRALWFCLLPVVFVGVASDLPAQRVKSDQEILIELERGWDAAFHRHDVAFIDGLLAEEFVATYNDGSRGDRAKELALARDFDQQVDSSTLDEFTVKVYGDTAVVWFTQHLLGPKNGKPLAITLRYVDVCLLQRAIWLLRRAIT